MEVIKNYIHKITVKMSCKCQVTRDYEDGRYEKPCSDIIFTPCAKHEPLEDVANAMEDALVDFLEKEAKDSAAQPRGSSIGDVANRNDMIRTNHDGTQSIRLNMSRTGTGNAKIAPSGSGGVVEAPASNSIRVGGSDPQPPRVSVGGHTHSRGGGGRSLPSRSDGPQRPLPPGQRTGGVNPGALESGRLPELEVEFD